MKLPEGLTEHIGRIEVENCFMRRDHVNAHKQNLELLSKVAINNEKIESLELRNSILKSACNDFKEALSLKDNAVKLILLALYEMYHIESVREDELSCMIKSLIDDIKGRE